MKKFEDFKKKYMKDLSGSTVSESEFKRLKGNVSNEYINDLSGATMSDAERERLLQSMQKQKKGGSIKKSKIQKAYIGKAVRQPTETDKEFEMRHEYHTPFKGPQKAKKGGMARGTGAAIRGTNFKGIF